ncbi:MAG: isoprenyl transferase [Bacteroidales bacterium]|nr:isoprenyl transferase [Bacteroidales bacterium]
MATLSQLDKAKMPKHVAIIMDGNGRWAKARNLDRSAGHKAGVKALHNVLDAADKAGIEYVTVYTFSTENWNRPKEEVDALMNLIAWGIDQEKQEMIDRNVRLRIVGDISRMPDFARHKTEECVEALKHCTGSTLVVAFNYGSRFELTSAMQQIAQEVKQGQLQPDDITEQTINEHLFTKGMPEPELLIRTGGEKRISNYLLWQIAYSELYFCDTYWPDFGADELYDAILDYQSRERRFGKTSAQVQEENNQA